PERTSGVSSSARRPTSRASYAERNASTTRTASTPLGDEPGGLGGPTSTVGGCSAGTVSGGATGVGSTVATRGRGVAATGARGAEGGTGGVGTAATAPLGASSWSSGHTPSLASWVWDPRRERPAATSDATMTTAAIVPHRRILLRFVDRIPVSGGNN